MTQSHSLSARESLLPRRRRRGLVLGVVPALVVVMD
jgi:hypothetical protein